MRVPTYLAILTVVLVTHTWIAAQRREARVSSIRPGMQQREVEQLLGPGSKVDPTDPWNWYEANPTLWYGRFEDKLYIYYEDGVVQEIDRIGL